LASLGSVLAEGYFNIRSVEGGMEGYQHNADV
jgi:hypothetical protein